MTRIPAPMLRTLPMVVTAHHELQFRECEVPPDTYAYSIGFRVVYSG